MLLAALPFSESALPMVAAVLAIAVASWSVILLRHHRTERDHALEAMDRLVKVAGYLSAQVDLKGGWSRVSQDLCTLLGRTESELLGKSIFECLHPSDQESSRAHCVELLGGGRPSCAMEARIQRPDGSEVWLEMDGMRVATRSGRPSHLQVIVRDISEAKAVAQALKDSEEKFRTLSDNINCGVFLYTDVFHFINPGMEQITGYSAEELLNQPFWKTVHPDEQQLVHQRGEARRRGEEVPKRYVMKLLHKSGHTIYVDFIARAVTLGGKVYGLGTAFDITDRVHATEERLRLERQLLEAQKLESLGLLAGGIAHDFNNLLTVILGNASIILEESPKSDLIHACAKTVVDTCQRASSLTRQMLAYSGRGRLVVEPLDLNATVQGIVSLVESSLPKPITLRYELTEGLPGLEADHTQLQQVILNLITNASESLGAGRGVITVRTGSEHLDAAALAASFSGQELDPGPFVCLEVEDTGLGMDATTQARIFEPFFSTKGAGRGLGLAAMQGIVRGHRGGIWIRSEAAGGTTFHVVFPALSSAVPRPMEIPSEPDSWRGSGLVLLVDDEETIRELAALALRRAGFDVVEAGDGSSAVEAFRRHAPNLRAVVLDLVMPLMGGEAALAEMMEIAPQIPVVLCSGYPGDNPGPGLSVRPFLAKPYTIAQLVEKVRSVVQA